MSTTTPAVRHVRTRASSAVPLYLLLATDIANGITSLGAPGVFGTPALAIKIVIALYLSSRVHWTLSSLAEVGSVALCFFAYLVALPTGPDATALMLKTGAVIVLLDLLRRYLMLLPQRSVILFVRTALVVIAASLMLGLLGVGHDRYGDSAALLQANGFLPAGNEINVALVGLFWWLSARRHSGHRSTVDSAFYWLCLVLMVLSTSKTTIVGAAITILYFLRQHKTSVLIIAAAAPIAIYLLMSSQVWERWAYFYDIYADQGTLSALTSGRFGRIDEFGVELLALLINGVGVLANSAGYIESDPVDLLFNFGVIGLLLYALFGVGIWRACRGLLTPWLLVMATSLLAGHVVYSVFAAPILSCALHARTPGQPRPWPRRQRARPAFIGAEGSPAIGFR